MSEKQLGIEWSNQWTRPLGSGAAMGLAALFVLACSGGSETAPGQSDTNAASGGAAGTTGGEVGGSSGSGGASGSGQCPTSPPAAPSDEACSDWSCAESESPQCWDCEWVAGDDGSACVPPGGADGAGACSEGSCVAVADPGVSGGPPGNQSSAEIELSGGLFGTKIPLDIYTPVGAGPFPVIIFTHGFQLDAKPYASYGEHLATWDYVAVLPSFPAGIIGGANHVELKDYLIKVIDWVEENASDPGGPLSGKADASQIGLAGHSMGGKISIFTATEDSRPRAVFGVDPVDSAGGPVPMPEADYPSVTPERMNKLMVPIGVVGETLNGTCDGVACMPCAPEADNFQQYFQHAAGPALEIEIIGANHMSFLDSDGGLAGMFCPKGTDDVNTTRYLTKRYLTAFFNLTLKGQQAFRAYLDGAGIQADADQGLVVYQTKNGL